jgi:hypothetical protein
LLLGGRLLLGMLLLGQLLLRHRVQLQQGLGQLVLLPGLQVEVQELLQLVEGI